MQYGRLSEKDDIGIRIHESTLNYLTARGGSLSRQDKSNNEPIKRERLRENEDENHDNEKLRLLSCSAYSCVADDTNADTGGEAGETIGKSGGEMGEAQEVWVVNFSDVSDKDDGDNQTLFSKIHGARLRKRELARFQSLSSAAPVQGMGEWCANVRRCLFVHDGAGPL